MSGVEWVDPATLVANDYNPNHVAPIEMGLLKTSILENGWTQPIVTRTPEGPLVEIVDGFHRWTLGMTDEDVRALTDGLVPVVRLWEQLDPVTQRLSTIRHNRARGVHQVVKMADIVIALQEMGADPDDIMERLGMEADEVVRLSDRGHMASRGSAEFGPGWVPGKRGEEPE